MAKNVLNRIDRHLARRLREARREVGHSTRTIAKMLSPRLAMSHVTIAAYENGTTTPPIDALAALADLYQRPLNWFMENRQTLENFRYHNMKSRIRLAEQRQFEAQASKWAEAYFRLGEHLNGAGTRNHKAHSCPNGSPHSPTDLAAIVRGKLLKLADEQPIQSMVEVLESFSTWAIELKTSFGIESAAARRGADFVVVLNPIATNDRVRLTAAYELAHILYDGCQEPVGKTESDVERMAYEFASSLLLPESQLERAFEGRSFLKLIQFKERFGISLSSMIYMAEKSKIINSTTSRFLWREMSNRGWRHNEPGFVWRDRAISFETMLECAIQGRQLTWPEAERITGIREQELKARLSSAITPSTEDAQEEQPAIIGLGTWNGK